MSEMLMKKSRVLCAALLGIITAVSLTLWGCGSTGTQGYDVPVNPVTTTNSPAIINAATLKLWVDQGKLNAPLGNPDRVVLVSMATLGNYTTISKKHIPGAVLMDTTTDLYTIREEGLGPVPYMVPSGLQMDAVIQKLGIDNHTTIVLTIPRSSSDSEQWQQSRAYWTFRYWGFARERVKMLNGGDDAWDVASLPFITSKTVVTPSNYTVAGNKILKDVLRYSIGKMIGRVDTLITDNTLLNSWQMLDARGPTVSPYMTNALRANTRAGESAPSMMFLGDRVNGVATKNRLYPDKATLISRMATLPVKNGATDVYLSFTKKTVVMCGGGISASPSFVLFDAVLAVPEGDIMMYNGSSSQWTGYSLARITAANPGVSASQIGAWAFDFGTTPRAQGAMPTTGSLATMLPGSATYSPSQLEMNQVEQADKAYMNTTIPTSTNGGTPVPGGVSSGGGC